MMREMPCRHWVVVAVSLFALTVLFGCSGDNEENPVIFTVDDTEGVIGPAGGTIQIPGYVSLTVPPGALSDTVRFTITPCPSADPIADNVPFVSSCYSIEPSGTVFSLSAVLTMTYSDALFVGDAIEDSVRLFTHDGSHWSPLPTSISKSSNQVAAAITHLSDFVAAADTTTFVPPPADGVYAEFVVGRSIYLEEDEAEPFRLDLIVARFDSAYAPCSPIIPLHPDSAYCNQYHLTWNEAGRYYAYSDYVSLSFLELGGKYAFRVHGNSDVPSLIDTIGLPIKEQYVTEPANNDTVSAEGFDIFWANPGGGSLRLIIVGEESDSLVVVEDVINNGSFSFTADYLAGLRPGEYGLILIRENRQALEAQGYDPRSQIVGKITNVTMLYIQ